MKNRIQNSALLAAALLVSAPASLANGPDAWQWVKPSTATIGTLIAAGIPLFLLHNRKSEKKFKSRFSWETLKNNPLSTEGLNQLGYLFYDEFIGQKSESSKLKASKEDGSLEFSESIDPYGVLGTANGYIKPCKYAVETLATGYIGYLAIMKPDALWGFLAPKDKKNFDAVKPAPAPTTPEPTPAA